MAATARSVCASAPNIPIIADAGKVSNFGSDKKKVSNFVSKVYIFGSDKNKVSNFGSKVSNVGSKLNKTSY